MSQELSNYVYLDAKERAFEMEIEARKLFEMKKESIKRDNFTKINDDFQNRKDLKET